MPAERPKTRRGPPGTRCRSGPPDLLRARHLQSSRLPNFVGAMNFPNLVFNVHVYCTQRSGKTGNPTNIAACAAQEGHSLQTRAEDRTDLSSPAQPRGPAWFVSEFGATSNPGLLDQLTREADRFLVGWTYWSWKYYGDPTGSAAEALVTAKGSSGPPPTSWLGHTPRRSPVDRSLFHSIRRMERSTSSTFPIMRARSNRGLRPDTGSLPQRLLRSGIRGFGDLPTRQSAARGG